MNSTLSANLKSFGGRLVAVSALAITLGVTSAAACSLANWSSASGGIVANQPDGAAGDPVSDSTSVARFSGLCGSFAASGTGGFTQDNRPGGLDAIIARFYVLGDSSVAGTFYEGFSDTTGGGSLFNVGFSGGNIVANSGGATASVAVTGTQWFGVEVAWASNGDITLTVEGESPDTASGTATGSLSSVRLGNLDSAATDMTFDGYEAHLSTEVGFFCRGDTDGNNARDFDDLFAIFDDISNPAFLAVGQPDINGDGSVEFGDIFAIFDLISTGSGACPA